MPKYQRIVLDTVTISNFIKVGKLDLLCELYAGSLYVTKMVIIELGKGDIDIANWIQSGQIKEAIFDYDLTIQKDLSDNLHDGEISCNIYGVKSDCAIATDEKKARNIITEIYRHRKLTGTVGLLIELVQEQLITRQYAEQLLAEMIERGFWYKGDIPFE